MVVDGGILVCGCPGHTCRKIVPYLPFPSLYRVSAFGRTGVHAVWVVQALVLSALGNEFHAAYVFNGGIRETAAPSSESDFFGYVQPVGIYVEERRGVALCGPFPVGIIVAQRFMALYVVPEPFVRRCPSVNRFVTEV